MMMYDVGGGVPHSVAEQVTPEGGATVSPARRLHPDSTEGFSLSVKVKLSAAAGRVFKLAGEDARKCRDTQKEPVLQKFHTVKVSERGSSDALPRRRVSSRLGSVGFMEFSSMTTGVKLVEQLEVRSEFSGRCLHLFTHLSLMP